MGQRAMRLQHFYSRPYGKVLRSLRRAPLLLFREIEFD